MSHSVNIHLAEQGVMLKQLVCLILFEICENSRLVKHEWRGCFELIRINPNQSESSWIKPKTRKFLNLKNPVEECLCNSKFEWNRIKTEPVQIRVYIWIYGSGWHNWMNFVFFLKLFRRCSKCSKLNSGISVLKLTK